MNLNAKISIFEVPEKEFLKIMKLKGKLYNVSFWDGKVEIKIYEKVKE